MHSIVLINIEHSIDRVLLWLWVLVYSLYYSVLMHLFVQFIWIVLHFDWTISYIFQLIVSAFISTTTTTRKLVLLSTWARTTVIGFLFFFQYVFHLYIYNICEVVCRKRKCTHTHTDWNMRTIDATWQKPHSMPYTTIVTAALLYGVGGAATAAVDNFDVVVFFSALLEYGRCL